MALKDIWEDLKDATEGVAGSGDDITVEPINKIAHAIINLEENSGIVENTAPYIGNNGNWYVWDNTSKSYVDTGTQAEGKTATPLFVVRTIGPRKTRRKS